MNLSVAIGALKQVIGAIVNIPCRALSIRNGIVSRTARKSSFNLQKVMWLIGQLGIAHKHVELGGSFGGLDTAEFLAMNPHGRIPVIDD